MWQVDMDKFVEKSYLSFCLMWSICLSWNKPSKPEGVQCDIDWNRNFTWSKRRENMCLEKVLIIEEYHLQAWRSKSCLPFTLFSGPSKTVKQLLGCKVKEHKNSKMEKRRRKNRDIEECDLGNLDAMGSPLHAQGPHPHSNREKAHCLQSINHPKPGKVQT